MSSIPGKFARSQQMFASAYVLMAAMSVARAPAQAVSSMASAPPQPGVFAGSTLAAARKQAVLGNYLRVPLQFEANQGQVDKQVQFLSRGQGYSLFLTPADAVLTLRTPTKQAKVEMVMAGGNQKAPATGLDPSGALGNYFIGNDPAKWQTSVAEFRQVRYQDLYPGIDLIFYGNQQQLEYDFVVAPGADPQAIKLQFKGARSLHLNPQGDLVLSTAAGDVRLNHPALYQESANGTRSAVQGTFALARNEVHFKVGSYDKGRPLVIDPVLAYSTFLGGSGSEDFYTDSFSASYLTGIAVGSDGSVYVSGTTNSTNFPTVGPYQATTSGGPSDIFIAKLNPTATALVYSTYLGGSALDSGGGMAVDSNGDAYIAGSTQSTNFPVTTGAIQSTLPAVVSGFVTKLNPAGNSLLYSTYLGGTGGSAITAVAVDANGSAYVTGYDKKGFPTTAGSFQTTVPGSGLNPFVAKLAVDGKSLVYGTYIGGEKTDVGRGIAVDEVGSAYVAGFTSSVHFPIVPAVGAIQPAIGSTDGTNDAFVLKLNPTGSALVYSTYLGGASRDEAYAIAVDQSGNASIAGLTTSANFPTASPLQAAQGSTVVGANVDAFVAKINPAGTALIFSTYLGGNQVDFAEGIATDLAGNVFVAGITGSSGAIQKFPVLNPLPNSGVDATLAFVTEYNPTGTAYIYSTLFGGSLTVEAAAMALDAKGNVYITGFNGFSTDMPVTPGVFQPTLNGSEDAFVVKLWPLSLTPATLAFPNTIVNTTSAPLTATLTNSGSDTLNISALAITGGNTADFAETTTCGNTLAAQSSCTISVTFKPLAVAPYASAVDVTDSAAVLPQVVTLTGNGIAGSTTPQAVLTPSAVPFGNQTVGTTSAAQVVVLSNPGTATLNIASINLTGSNPTFFALNSACGATLAPGTSCNISANFTPPSANPFSASLTVTDNATPPTQSTSLTGTGTAAPAAQIVLTPSSLVFPGQTVGTTSATQTVVMSNPGTANLVFTSIAITGANLTNFAVNSANCISPLQPAASCNITVSFTPNAVGPFSAGITIAVSNSNLTTQIVPISGTGTVAAAPLAVLSPTSLTFPITPVGTTTAAQPVTLSNPGNAPLAIAGISIIGANLADFAQTSTCTATLAASASCIISITFTPASVASFTAALSVTDNAAGSPQTAPLAGTGGAPPTFTVSSTTPTETVSYGAIGRFNISVTSVGGSFTNPVILSATGLPSGYTVAFAPTTVAPGSAGATSIMSVQTPSLLVSTDSPGTPGRGSLPLLALAGVPLLGILGWRRRNRTTLRLWMTLALATFALLPVVALAGCAGGYFAATPQTYVITVTGTSGSLQQSTPVSLTVQ